MEATTTRRPTMQEEAEAILLMARLNMLTAQGRLDAIGAYGLMQHTSKSIAAMEEALTANGTPYGLDRDLEARR